MSHILLDANRCKRCGICVDLCPSQVYKVTGEGYPDPVNIDKCTKCRLCELWCPDYALQIEV